MLRISGKKKLRKDDIQILREAAKFTLDKLVAPSIQKKISVRIRLNDDCDGWEGECCYVGNENNIRKFDISVSLNRMNENAKKPIARMKEPIRTIIHELVHVKQYANNQLFDYKDGKTKFEGQIYKRTTPSFKYTDYERYWDSPWEVEAYGRTEGIYELFKINHRRKQRNESVKK
jgi:hypothetical protein